MELNIYIIMARLQGGSGEVILSVSKNSTTHWQWYYVNGTTSYPTIYYGYTSTSSGSTSSKSLSSLLTSVKTLNTNNTTSQATQTSESISGSGSINLHKVSKTGNYNDLLNKPTLYNHYLTIILNDGEDDFYLYANIISSKNSSLVAEDLMGKRFTVWGDEDGYACYCMFRMYMYNNITYFMVRTYNFKSGGFSDDLYTYTDLQDIDDIITSL